MKVLPNNEDTSKKKRGKTKPKRIKPCFKMSEINRRYSLESPVVRTQLLLQGAQVQSLVRELRSHRWYKTAKRKKEGN